MSTYKVERERVVYGHGECKALLLLMVSPSANEIFRVLRFNFVLNLNKNERLLI